MRNRLKDLIQKGIKGTMKEPLSLRRENTLYVLESDNVKTDSMFQYVEEMALLIQHNVGLRSFFRGEVYSEADVTEQLKSAVNLFQSLLFIVSNAQPFLSNHMYSSNKLILVY